MTTRAWIDTLCPECKARLIELFAGRVLRVPYATTSAAERRAGIRKALDAGITYSEVENLFHCSRATVAAAGKRED